MHSIAIIIWTILGVIVIATVIDAFFFLTQLRKSGRDCEELNRKLAEKYRSYDDWQS